MAKFSNIPPMIYEAMPYLYGGFGVVSIAMLDSIMGTISGVALITAGIMIWRLRYIYRQRRKRREDPPNLGWVANQEKFPPKDDKKLDEQIKGLFRRPDEPPSGAGRYAQRRRRR